MIEIDVFYLYKQLTTNGNIHQDQVPEFQENTVSSTNWNIVVKWREATNKDWNSINSKDCWKIQSRISEIELIGIKTETLKGKIWSRFICANLKLLTLNNSSVSREGKHCEKNSSNKNTCENSVNSKDTWMIESHISDDLWNRNQLWNRLDWNKNQTLKDHIWNLKNICLCKPLITGITNIQWNRFKHSEMTPQALRDWSIAV